MPGDLRAPARRAHLIVYKQGFALFRRTAGDGLKLGLVRPVPGVVVEAEGDSDRALVHALRAYPADFAGLLSRCRAVYVRPHHLAPRCAMPDGGHEVRRDAGLAQVPDVLAEAAPVQVHAIKLSKRLVQKLGGHGLHKARVHPAEGLRQHFRQSPLFKAERQIEPVARARAHAAVSGAHRGDPLGYGALRVGIYRQGIVRM